MFELLAAAEGLRGKVVVIESKVQCDVFLDGVRRGKVHLRWDFGEEYELLCERVEKTPRLPGLKKEFAYVVTLPGRASEPFIVVSALSIATHVKGAWSLPAAPDRHFFSLAAVDTN